jgi:hypothetical protein
MANRSSTADGGALRKLIAELRCAALIDSGLLRACRPFGTRLGVLVEHGRPAATYGRPKAQPKGLNDNDNDRDRG